MSQCVDAISQETLAFLLKETVHALLDNRLDAANYQKNDSPDIKNIVRLINKVRNTEFIYSEV